MTAWAVGAYRRGEARAGDAVQSIAEPPSTTSV